MDRVRRFFMGGDGVVDVGGNGIVCGLGAVWGNTDCQSMPRGGCGALSRLCWVVGVGRNGIAWG